MSAGSVVSNRLLWNEDGKTLDEIVYHGYIHVEQMDDDHYWAGIGESHFDFVAIKKGRLDLTGHDIRAKDFPLEQRHMTEAETETWIAGGCEGEPYITIRDERTDKERVDEQAMYLAAKDGKGWRQMTGWQRDKYRRRVRREAA
jgi:hypothetical protein